MPDDARALVIGVTGISGHNAAERLLANGWEVVGVSRTPRTDMPGVRHIAVDITDAEATRSALADADPTHVFFGTWSRQPTEAENIRVNGAMLRNVLQAVERAPRLRHVALVTGLKHYLGPFESYGKVKPDTPFREEQGRLEYENFYYEQEDILFEVADRVGFTWSVHRAHTMIGWAIGNLMNMGVTLALYGSICRETGRPFVFPGSPEQWDGVTDVTDARLLARQLEWAATTPAAANEAFNVVNGDVFRACSQEASASSPLRIRGTPPRSRSRWPRRGRSGTRSSAATACCGTSSTGSPLGGTRMPTSRVRSRRSRA